LSIDIVTKIQHCFCY